MTLSRPKYGMFAPSAVPSSGIALYSKADGTTVEITCVVEEPSSYAWPDAENRGHVVKFVRQLQAPSFPWNAPLFIPNVSSCRHDDKTEER